MTEMAVLKLMDQLADYWHAKTGDRWWLNLAITIERQMKPAELERRRHARD